VLDQLQRVAAALRAHDVPFLLGGSLLLRALGHDVPVRDVDLMVRAQDRERFEAATARWHVRTTTDPGPVLTSAWKATLDVDGVEVEGLGGLRVVGGRELPFRQRGEWQGVPLAAHEVWREAYAAYAPEKAALLEYGDAMDERHLRRAIELAVQAREAGEQPFGSLLVGPDGDVLAEDHNTVLGDGDITAHPELKLARWAAANLEPADAERTTMYTSCQPCGMCANTIARARLGRVVFALSAEQLAGAKPAGTQAPDAFEVAYDGPHLHDEASAAVAGYYD
jgi:tRNA(Arg) A34 adenosine deaminase TadA